MKGGEGGGEEVGRERGSGEVGGERCVCGGRGEGRDPLCDALDSRQKRPGK